MKETVSHTHDAPSNGSPHMLAPGRIWELILSVLRIIFGWPKHPLQHFTLGKINLHVEHTDGLTQDELSKAIASFLEKQNPNQKWKSKLAPPKPEDIITLRPKDAKDTNAKALSILSTRLRDEKTNQRDLIKLLKNIDAELSKGGINISGNVFLKSVAPNWFVGSASHGIGTTGPGGWPVEAPPMTGNGWLIYEDKDQNSRANAPSLLNNAPKTKVQVAILDTAPAYSDLDEVYKKWGAKHPLLERLWGGSRKLQLDKSISIDLDEDVGLTGHNYPMRDHGSFVAGIINSIAPEAELHLIETFTPNGVSSAETIARALVKALDLGRPLIINCSFNLSKDKDDKLPPQIQEMVAKSWGDLFDWLGKQDDVVVVGAAGNDAEPGKGRPAARFLAAFDNVVGVGALPKEPLLPNGKYKAASYSNLAHHPPDAGYMTLGGEPGSEQGILGIYISKFPVYVPPQGCLAFLLRIFTRKGHAWKGPGHLPPYPFALTADRVGFKPNENGWAWWAGTSFATPVISGILANWCSLPASGRDPINLANAKKALDERSQTVNTKENEKVILVKQG